MPNVRDYRQPHGLFIQALRRSRPAHAPAVFPACVFGYCGFSSLGAGGEEFSHSLREPLHVLPIHLFSPDGFALSAPLSDLAVGQTFLFGLFQRLLLDQQPLPFVPIPRAAPFQDHRRERRMLFRPPRQRRVAGREKDQMIQIGASQTQRAFLFDQCDPGFGTEIFAALAAGGFAGRDEDFEFFCFVLLRCHSYPQWRLMARAQPMSGDRHSARLL